MANNTIATDNIATDNIATDNIADNTLADRADFNQPLPLAIATLVDVRAGKAMPFTREQLSAIDKASITAPVTVNFMGLTTDEQADRRHHGGPLKAVHQLSPRTYDLINAEFDLNVRVGTLGENLITQAIEGVADMDESTVCIGDVFQYGDGDSRVQLRVVQPRRPCYKINDQIGQFKTKQLPNIASWVSKQGISGWYYEVVRDGEMAIGLPVYLVERPYPFATLTRLWQLANSKTTYAPEVIDPWLTIACLEDSWKMVLKKKRAQA